MNKQHVQLSPVDREYLEALISKGELKAKTYRRALSLLELDRGQTYTAVSKTVKMTIATLSTLAHQYEVIDYKLCMIDHALADPSRLMGNNVRKSLPWPVVHYQKDTLNGVCAYWQIKWLSLVLASKSRIHMCARF